MRNFLRIYIFFLLLSLLFAGLNAQQTHSGNEDGNYTNAVIAADFPDPDVIGSEK